MDRLDRPADGNIPERPHRIAVLTPIATRAQHLGLRWLARRPARRIGLGSVSMRTSTAVVAALSLAAATLAIIHSVPVSIVLPTAALVPLLAEHLPGPLDARAFENVRIVEDEAACRYLQRLAALHTGLVHAAADSDAYQLRPAVEIGHHQLFDTADLLQRHDTRSASSELVAREHLLLQLASQIVASAQGDASLGPYPPGPRRQPPASAQATTRISSMKEETDMPHLQGGPAQRTSEVYLLFAHEAYHPAAAREITAAAHL
jgi:hypothetical protein